MYVCGCKNTSQQAFREICLSEKHQQKSFDIVTLECVQISYRCVQEISGSRECKLLQIERST